MEIKTRMITTFDVRYNEVIINVDEIKKVCIAPGRCNNSEGAAYNILTDEGFKLERESRGNGCPDFRVLNPKEVGYDYVEVKTKNIAFTDSQINFFDKTNKKILVILIELTILR